MRSLSDVNVSLKTFCTWIRLSLTPSKVLLCSVQGAGRCSSDKMLIFTVRNDQDSEQHAHKTAPVGPRPQQSCQPRVSERAVACDHFVDDRVLEASSAEHVRSTWPIFMRQRVAGRRGARQWAMAMPPGTTKPVSRPAEVRQTEHFAQRTAGWAEETKSVT